jgi:hypothetical protein
MRNAYNILVVNSERKRSFGRPRCKREDNVRMNLREIVRSSGLDASGSG